jgi:hypothetical protein
MHLDEPFPLEVLPSRLRNVILQEFEGRCPSIEEVAQIPDRQWQSTPGIGQKFIKIIHDIINASREHTTDPQNVRLTDLELLRRLEVFQNEVRWLHAVLRERMSVPDPPYGMRKSRQRQVSQLMTPRN